MQQVARECKAKPGDLRGGISTQTVSGNISKNGQTPLVAITVQTAKRRLAACAANALARQVVDRTSAFANQKIANFSAQISNDERNIAQINEALEQRLPLGHRQARRSDPPRAGADRQAPDTRQFLLQAKQIEKPGILTGASAQRVTARSRRNTVVVAALIGLILGAVAALMWDGVAAGMSRRRGA